ncbi:MAG: hypothetical protein AAGA85_26720 [Bacteroidota bacterium]
MKHRLCILTLLTLVTFVHAQGHERPDLSGQWDLNLEKSNLEADWTEGITGGTFDILHQEPDFKLSRVFEFKRKKKQAFEIRTDGPEQKGKFKTTWYMVWRESRLFLTVLRKGMENTVEYYLSSTGELIADERFTSSRMNYHNRWVFDNAPDVTPD